MCAVAYQSLRMGKEVFGVKKFRLDVLLAEKDIVSSREQARQLILAGHVVVDGAPVVKPGTRVAQDADVGLRGTLPYVSRGGLKLEAALDAFGVNVAARVVVDVGASTGGFTDCLLQRGAARVYAVDVGQDQMARRLREDPRVVVMERTDIRHLEALPEPVDLATVDVSFIGLQLVLPAVMRLLKPEGEVIALIKPQFEAGPEHVGKGGVVKDPEVHRTVLRRVLYWATSHHLALRGLIPSPRLGAAGNAEFLAYLSLASGQVTLDVERAIWSCTADTPPEKPLTSSH